MLKEALEEVITIEKHSVCHEAQTDDRVICLQGGGRTSSGKQGGDGWSSSGTAYTLNTVDVHGVCFGLSRSFLTGGGNTVPDVVYPINTMVALRGGKDDMRTCFGVGEPGDPQFTISAAHEHAIAYAIDQQGGKGMAAYSENTAPTLCSDSHGTPHAVCFPVESIGHDLRSTQFSNGGHCDPLTASDYKDAMVVCYAPGENCCGTYSKSDISATLETRYHYGSGGDAAMVVCYKPSSHQAWKQSDSTGTLTAENSNHIRGDTTFVVYDARGNGDGETVPTITGDHQNRVSDYTSLMVYPQKTGALCANSHPGSYTGQDAFNDMLPVIQSNKPPRKYIVRRLTPLECCRLQGFPDYWTDGVDGSDSAKYKMWGNGIALPCAADVLRRISGAMDEQQEAVKWG